MVLFCFFFNCSFNKMRFTKLFVLFLTLFVLLSSYCVFGSADWSEDQYPEKWFRYSREKLTESLNRKVNNKIAKNVIIFLGDGNFLRRK